ncbi:GNAT family N-acetyltransferase [Jeotgalibacillus sp. R-1-5s-1]|uniref:GNAT family N-acetyltransferase n=1 Tax=Jeotgalibacillus sp. R-1-5s-1 TaxID=2555897 RepID=UPI00106DD2B1|nr:GNAT family N-acetyltransferase [Jeotgalibacillus sp. R-1-5s-1]TFD96262.1 GNAT family N-acetyltransferase [Jeotgalibacillus sp. R-1-5s-1]
MKLERITKQSKDFEAALDLFWGTWGSEDNRMFYGDCMRNASGDDVPRFYVVRDGENMIGTVALLRNELVSRQDLTPWLACLFVNSDYRGQGIGFKMMEEVCREAASLGYEYVHLSTDLEGYYEKAGWTYFDEFYGLGGGKIKVYRSPLLNG